MQGWRFLAQYFEVAGGGWGWGEDQDQEGSGDPKQGRMGWQTGLTGEGQCFLIIGGGQSGVSR